MMNDKQIEIYQGDDGQAEIEVRLEAETVWLTQSQETGRNWGQMAISWSGRR